MVAHQGVQHAREGAHPVKRLTAPLDHRPGWGIGIAVAGARGAEPLPHGDPVAQRPAWRCVETAPLQTLAPRRACDCTPRPLSAAEETIIGIAGVVHPILVGQEGATPRAHGAHMLPGCGAARQPTPLQPQAEADRVHRDRGEAPCALPTIRSWAVRTVRGGPGRERE